MKKPAAFLVLMGLLGGCRQATSAEVGQANTRGAAPAATMQAAGRAYSINARVVPAGATGLPLRQPAGLP